MANVVSFRDKIYLTRTTHQQHQYQPARARVYWEKYTNSVRWEEPPTSRTAQTTTSWPVWELLYSSITDPRYTWAEKFERFERINSIRETDGNFDSCNSCKRLVPSRLHELHESKFPSVSRIEFIRSKRSNFSAHVNGVSDPVYMSRKIAVTTAPMTPFPTKEHTHTESASAGSVALRPEPERNQGDAPGAGAGAGMKYTDLHRWRRRHSSDRLWRAASGEVRPVITHTQHGCVCHRSPVLTAPVSAAPDRCAPIWARRDPACSAKTTPSGAWRRFWRDGTSRDALGRSQTEPGQRWRGRWGPGWDLPLPLAPVPCQGECVCVFMGAWWRVGLGMVNRQGRGTRSAEDPGQDAHIKNGADCLLEL